VREEKQGGAEKVGQKGRTEGRTGRKRGL